MNISFASRDIDDLLKSHPELLPDSVTEHLKEYGNTVDFEISASLKPTVNETEGANVQHSRVGSFAVVIGMFLTLYLAFMAVWVNPNTLPWGDILTVLSLNGLSWFIASAVSFLIYILIGYALTYATVASLGYVLGFKPKLINGYKGFPMLILNKDNNF